MPANATLGRLNQKDYKFGASLAYKGSSRLLWVIVRVCLKTTTVKEDPESPNI